MPVPSDSTVHHLLKRAKMLKFEAHYEEALAVLEQLLTHAPDMSEVLEEIADNELNLGRYARAGAAADRALLLNAKSHGALYILGFIDSHFERWKESIARLKEANRIEQNHPEILRCLGWSLFCVGREVEGVVTIERALNLDPENPLTLCDLGVVYLRLQNFTKSKALLKRALDLEPENERAEECLKMVERIEQSAKK